MSFLEANERHSMYFFLTPKIDIWHLTTKVQELCESVKSQKNQKGIFPK